MNLERVKQLVNAAARAGIDELELHENGLEVRVMLRCPPVVAATGTPAAPTIPAAPVAPAAIPSVIQAPEPAPVAAATAGVTVRAPMVGTFYRCATPGGTPLAEIGQRLEVGAVTCVIEAMKIMNEIETESAGTVSEVLCEDGAMVQPGQPLFVIS